MLPSEEALIGGSLTLCCEEKQLNLHNAAPHFRGRSSLQKVARAGLRRIREKRPRAHAPDGEK
jgi:hypothetical protein